MVASKTLMPLNTWDTIVSLAAALASRSMCSRIVGVMSLPGSSERSPMRSLIMPRTTRARIVRASLDRCWAARSSVTSSPGSNGCCTGTDWVRRICHRPMRICCASLVYGPLALHTRPMLPIPIGPGRHLSDREKIIVGQWVVREYAKGRSIREIGADLGRSYGFVRRLLHAHEVELRPKGSTPDDPPTKPAG